MEQPLWNVYNVLYLQTSMLGMKRDCGGAAGILGGFRAAVKQVGAKSQKKKIKYKNVIRNNFHAFYFPLQGFTENLHAVFCMAENAVGPHATRPDDILTLYSGK